MTTWIDDKIREEYYNSDEYQEYLRKLSQDASTKKSDKIFTASKAREKLNKVLENDDKELIEIMKKIDGAINRKQNYVYVSASIGNHTIKKLQNLGYTIGDIIKGDRPFDADTRKISW